MVTILKKYIRQILKEEIGRDLKTVKFHDQVDILKDPRVSVEFMVINKGDYVEHKVKIDVHDDESLSTDSIAFSSNDEATHWARNMVKNILVKLDQEKS